MLPDSALIATDIDAYLDAARAQGAAALPHVRQRGRRQEHADRPAAVRHQDDLRGSARRGEERQRAAAARPAATWTCRFSPTACEAEREQGITIDVAYRYFSTARRKFIIADTPGHEQYTRNMATGASTCDVAIILIDARHGVMRQTRRHSFIASLLGIRHVVVAVNKMDLVELLPRRSSSASSRRTREFAAKLEFARPPLHPRVGPARRQRRGPERAHAVVPRRDAAALPRDRARRVGSEPDRLPLSRCSTSTGRTCDFRGFAGTIASGVVRPGDEVMALPSGRAAG